MNGVDGRAGSRGALAPVVFLGAVVFALTLALELPVPWLRPVCTLSRFPRIRADLVAIHWALAEHSVNRPGSWPEKLEALVDVGRLARVPRDPWKRVYRYELWRGAVAAPCVWTAGEDGLDFTADDVSLAGCPR